MISFHFNIRNPWSDRWKVIKSWAGVTPFQNKFWEVQIDETFDVIGIEFRLTSRQDHAGLYLSFALLGYDIILSVYDNRHWNHQTNDWEKYD